MNSTVLGNALASRVTEFLDGFVLVGFVAGTDEPLVVYGPTDRKTTLALNDLLKSAVRPTNEIKDTN